MNELIEKEIIQMKELTKTLEELDKSRISLQFITIDKFCELSGWSKKTAGELFNRKDFPSCNYGKEKIAELTAIKKYFSVPRRK